MDIRNWPMNQIMQLPDSCFGRRWPIIFTTSFDGLAMFRLISETALPDRCVLWELFLGVSFQNLSAPVGLIEVHLKLGDQEPTTDAIITAMDELLPDSDERDAIGRIYRPTLHLSQLRIPIMAQGRRVVVRINPLYEIAGEIVVALVFSSFPTEVPDCLLSV